jgi:hypothetical protein
MKLQNIKSLVLILLAALTGLLSSLPGSSDKWMGLWAIFPFLWAECDSVRAAFFTPFAFYLAVSRGIVPGAYIFFQDGDMLRAVFLWASSAAALSFPWWLFWSSSPAAASKTLKMALALFVSIPPPLGMIGWTHPVTAAGLFFPGLGWRGLALTVILYAVGSASRKGNRMIIVSLLAVLPLLDFPASKALDGVAIRTVDTSFGRLASGSEDFNAQSERERQVFRHIRELYRRGELAGAEIVILPETIVGRMNPTTRKRWERFFSRWTDEGTVFLVGAEIPQGNGKIR